MQPYQRPIQQAFLVDAARAFEAEFGFEEVFVDFEERGGFDLEGEGGFLLFDLAGEFVAEDLLGVGGPVEADVGMEEEDLVDKKLRCAEDGVFVFAEIEEFGEGVGDGLFGEEINQELFDGQWRGGVNEAIDVPTVDLAAEDGEFLKLFGAQCQIVVEQRQQVGEGIVVDVHTQRLGFLGEDGDPVADIGLEEAHPHAPFFVREAGLQAAGIGAGALVGIEEVVVLVFVGQFDEGVELFFGDLFVAADEQEVCPAKQGTLGEVASGLVKRIFVMVESEGGV